VRSQVAATSTSRYVTGEITDWNFLHKLGAKSQPFIQQKNLGNFRARRKTEMSLEKLQTI